MMARLKARLRRLLALLVVGITAGIGTTGTAPTQTAGSARDTAWILEHSLGQSAVSRDGFVELTWTPANPKAPVPDRLRFQIEETPPDADVQILEAGSFRDSALSGRDDGRHVYRVRAIDEHGEMSPWSEPVEIHVDHYSLEWAYLALGVGGAVFVATILLIVVGHRRSRGATDPRTEGAT